MPGFVLFDLDGVLLTPSENFSRTYARQQSLEPGMFRSFFKGDFESALVGKADLKLLIKKHHDIWQWNDEPEKLLDIWFKAEHVVNRPVVKLVRELRRKGILCFIASNQETYRASYIANQIFPNQFDGMFFSSGIGYKKPDIEFFQKVISSLQNDYPEIQTDDIAFVDDSSENIESAKLVGMRGHIYSSSSSLDEFLKQIN